MKKQLATVFIFAMLGIALSGCSTSATSSRAEALSVGGPGPGGGTVFAFFDDQNTMGLEVYTRVIGRSAWGCAGVNVDDGITSRSRNGVGVPPGAESSEILRTANTSGICVADAAQLTFDFTNNGFDDWYLPSTDELVTIRELGLLPGISGDAYWSATEDSAQNAFAVLIRVTANPMDSGEPSTSSKDVIADVVPIRTF